MQPGIKVVDRSGNTGTVVNPKDYDWDSYPAGYSLILYTDWHIPQWARNSRLEVIQ